MHVVQLVAYSVRCGKGEGSNVRGVCSRSSGRGLTFERCLKSVICGNPSIAHTLAHVMRGITRIGEGRGTASLCILASTLVLCGGALEC